MWARASPLVQFIDENPMTKRETLRLTQRSLTFCNENGFPIT